MLGFGSRTGRTSRTGQTSPICPRTNTDSCSFAPFVLLRGLKTSTDFLLFPSHKRLKIEHERERAKKATFLCADFLIASAGTIRLSADRIRKPADTIRKKTKRVKKLFTKNTRRERFPYKVCATCRISHDFSLPRKQKRLAKFRRWRRREIFSRF